MFEVAQNFPTIEGTRELHRMAVRIPKTALRKTVLLSDKGASEGTLVVTAAADRGFKSHTVDLMTADIGFQTSLPKAEQGTNTPYAIQRNQQIQTVFEFNEAYMEDKTRDRLEKFLKESVDALEDIIVMNEAFDIYENELALGSQQLGKDMAQEQEEIMVIKELKCFEFEVGKAKSVSQIRFQGHTDLIATALRENLGFEERLEIQNRSFESMVMIWNSSEFHRFTPVAILLCPVEITTFAFKPNNPFVAVVGGANGQLFLYDLANLQVALRLNSNKSLGGKGGERAEETKLGAADGDLWRGNGEGESRTEKGGLSKGSDSNEVLIFKPILSSALLESYAASQNLFPTEVFSRKAVYVSSHRSAVKSISFLPPTVEFDKKNVGQFLDRPAGADPNSDQFLSLSEDGQLLFWDLNFADSKGTKTAKIGDSDLKKYVWKSLFSVQTFRSEQHLLPATTLVDQRDPTTEATLATDEGELFRVTYNFKDITSEELLNKSDFAKKIVGNPQKLLVTAAQVNPLIPNLLLMANEVSFSLFVNTCPQPLFTSAPTLGTRITCVRFSSNRPAVIYVGKDDGMVDAWDLLDHAGVPSQQHLVSAVGVSCIETSSIRTNVLAVGDKDGCLHLLQLPKSLCRPVNGEEASMQRFIEKELRRIQYYQAKFVDVENEAKRKKELEMAGEATFSAEKPTKEDPKVFAGGKTEEDALEDGFNAFLEENMLRVSAKPEGSEPKDK